MRLPLPFLVAALLLASLLPAGADPRRDAAVAAKVPPQPVPLTLTVERGGRVEIPLHVYGVQAETPRFLIRTRPEKGKLSAPQEAANHSALVVYEPPADLTIRSEKFTYAAQSSAGVSAACLVTIAIADAAPQLISPREMVFDPIQPGTTARQEFEIANLGGGLAEGEVIAPPPWRIEGSPAYRLKGGDRQKLALLFAPAAGGSFRGDLRFTSQGDRATPLSGEAALPAVESAAAPASAAAIPVNLSAEAPSVPMASPPPTLPVPVRARPVAFPGTTRPSSALTISDPEPSTAPTPPADTGRRLPILPRVRVAAWTSNSIDLRWPTSLTGGQPVRVEYRDRLEYDAKHELREVWRAITSAQFHTQGEETFAELHGLQPATLYTFRIVPAAAPGNTTPVFSIDAMTSRGQSTAVFTPLRLGLAALVFFVGMAVWRRLRTPE